MEVTLVQVGGRNLRTQVMMFHSSFVLICCRRVLRLRVGVIKKLIVAQLAFHGTQRFARARGGALLPPETCLCSSSRPTVTDWGWGDTSGRSSRNLLAFEGLSQRACGGFRVR
jgi:hypothetical protein